MTRPKKQPNPFDETPYSERIDYALKDYYSAAGTLSIRRAAQRYGVRYPSKGRLYQW